MRYETIEQIPERNKVYTEMMKTERKQNNKIKDKEQRRAKQGRRRTNARTKYTVFAERIRTRTNQGLCPLDESRKETERKM